MRIGIELEFTGIARKTCAALVMETTKGTYTEETYQYQDGSHSMDYVIKDDNGKKWTLHRDRSIRAEQNGEDSQVELITPVLEQDTEWACFFDIVKKLKEAGAKTNNSCGMHVHVDPFQDAELLKMKVIEFGKIQREICEKFNVDNQRLSRYCKMLPEGYISFLKRRFYHTKEELVEENIYELSNGYFEPEFQTHPARYYMMNLHSLLINGTVEFRFFNSVLDIEEIKRNVRWIHEFWKLPEDIIWKKCLSKKRK